MNTRIDLPRPKCTGEKLDIPIKNNSKNNETKLGRQVNEFVKSTWAFKSKITVEPFIVCYLLPSFFASFAVQNMCLEKSCLVSLHYSKRTCSDIMQGRTQNHTIEEKNIQTIISGMSGWSYPLQTAVSGILTLFIGSWSDRTGSRKTFMVVPILGKLISIIGIILSAVFFYEIGLNETALLEGLPPALGGGKAAMTMAVYSYITDITNDSERTFRLGIITAIYTISRPVGIALSGIMTKQFGYYIVFVISSVFYCVGLVYISLRLKEKKRKQVDEPRVLDALTALSLKDLVSTVQVVVRPREGARRAKFILTILCYMLIVGPVIGESQMTYWFTRFKFKFTEVDYSLYLTYSVLMNAIGSFITIYLFSKKLKMDDNVIGLFACMSRIASSVILALAPNRVVYFLGPLFDMFSSSAATSLRSIASKQVDADEIGKSSSLISISEALIPVVYSPIYSMVYKRYLSSFSGAFHLISGFLALPAVGIFAIMYIIGSSDKDQSTRKENITREKECTRF